MNIKRVQFGLAWGLVALAHLAWQGKIPHLTVFLSLTALKIVPNFGQALYLLGQLSLDNERYIAAKTFFQSVLEINGPNPALLNNLALALSKIFHFDAAYDAFRQALEITPDAIDIRLNFGFALRDGNHNEEALTVLEAVVADHPDHIQAMDLLSQILGEWGRSKEAIALLHKILILQPHRTSAWFNLSRLKRFTPEDPQIVQMEKLLAHAWMPTKKKILLLFALSKIYEDLDNKERSFALLKQGNRLKRTTLKYTTAMDATYFEQIMNVFHALFMTANQAMGDESQIPVFILGMPRSGTSLVEQILASHEHVYGGGERYDLFQLIQTLDRFSNLGQHYPNVMNELHPEEWLELGQTYVNQLRRLAPNAWRITNKMPHNFLHIGLINLALPNAKIIHCRREPMDTCFSCYQMLFSARHDYAYDLTELGHYYRLYDQLMQHWHQVLPGRILDVQYEKLVAHPKEEMQRLLDYCELPWDEACLQFYKTKRAVGTASFLQVRQPLYTTSVGRWKHYAHHLEPLKKALGPLAPLETD